MCELPPGSDKLTFNAFHVNKKYPTLTEAKNVSVEFAKGIDDFKWLVLLGQADCGKTHLAIAICRAWLKRGLPARYIFVPLMLDQLRRGYDKDGEDSYDKKLEFFMNVDLLVLDDLGSQVPTPWAIEKLTMIIDHRSVNELPMVVTTNKKLGELPGDDETRIGSRLQRFPDIKLITIEAPEYRTWRK